MTNLMPFHSNQERSTEVALDASAITRRAA